MKQAVCAGVCSLVVAWAASADLQNVTVGGSLRVYGAYYSEFFESADDGAVRLGPASLFPRPLGADGLVSAVRGDGHGHGLPFVEQRTVLNVRADFSDGVSAYVEVDALHTWGDAFRSDYVTGADSPALTGDGRLYQAYIELRDLAQLPLRLRVGRQELLFGSGWLVGPNLDADPFTALSFDAVRATWTADTVTVDAWWAKLEERSPIEEDGDVDFLGLYAACTAVEGMEFDAYALWVRDARSLSDTWWGPLNRLEHAAGLDDYDVTNLYTLGLRWAGERNAWDWELEAARQLGGADAVGVRFRPDNYGDSGATWGAWAAHGHVGYTLDRTWQPRLYLGAHYYGGEDNRRLSLWESFNPLAWRRASVSFNRLFSDHEVDAFLDGSALSNFWTASAGIELAPTDKIGAGLDVLYLETLESFAWPRHLTLAGRRIPVAPQYPWWTHDGDTDLGWQYTVWLTYAYSSSLDIEIGGTYYDTGQGLRDGAFLDGNGLAYVGARGTADAWCLYSELSLAF